ncbi:MAG: WG repeat-containing protein [Tidjanibacter sp.]|nr:WG repeat-containing protein [Tidjanibacter sp.]
MTPLLPIGAYIECLQNSELLAPELRHLLPADNFEREGFFATSKWLNFLLHDNEREYILTTPQAGQFARSERAIQMRVVHTRKCDYLADCQYIPNALTLFNSQAKSHLQAAILQPHHTPLYDFVRRHCSPTHRAHLHSALESIWHCAHTLTQTGLRHGSLTSTNIAFTPEGSVRILNYPIVGPAKCDDMEALAKAAIAIYIGGSELSAFKLLAELSNTPQHNHNKTLRTIASAAEHHGIGPLAELSKAILQKANHSTLLMLLQKLAREPFHPLTLLTQMLKTRTHNPLRIIPTEHPKQTEPHIKIDFSLCDQVMPASDLIVRYRRGNYWGYAHYNGEQIGVEKPLLGATDFEEGRAVVLTERGYGMIDSKGRFVLGDHWSEICWYCNENIATAADNDGRWHIYDRMGHQLSAVACDWMGDASEGFVVARRGNKYGYFSTSGHKRTDFIYDEAYGFSNGVARVCHNGHYYHIDTSLHHLSARLEHALEKE